MKRIPSSLYGVLFIVYKGSNRSQLPELQYLSQCLAQQTTAAETITNLIYEKVNKKGMIFGGIQKNNSKSKISVQQAAQKEIGNKVETRMRLLENQSNDTFNGNIDSLL